MRSSAKSAKKNKKDLLHLKDIYFHTEKIGTLCLRFRFFSVRPAAQVFMYFFRLRSYRKGLSSKYNMSLLQVQAIGIANGFHGFLCVAVCAYAVCIFPIEDGAPHNHLAPRGFFL